MDDTGHAGGSFIRWRRGSVDSGTDGVYSIPGMEPVDFVMLPV